MRTLSTSASPQASLLTITVWISCLATGACGGQSSPAPSAPPTLTTATTPPPPTSPQPAPETSSSKKNEPTFEHEVEFLRSHGAIEILEAPGGGKVAVSPDYQGRVMTSAVGANERSIGWVNHAFIEAGKTGTQFDNYGGEDRFWLGPEGGQFALFFPRGTEYALKSWQTPSGLQEGAWTVAEKSPTRIVFRRSIKVTNHLGTEFSVDVERTIDVLGPTDVERATGAPAGGGVKWIGFSTTNRITNTGTKAWTKDTGLPSVWLLGQYNPAPDAYVIIPFEPGKGEVVNDRYFGKPPADRLQVDTNDGYVLFKTDGQFRSKIGLRYERVKNVLGSYSASANLLTIVAYDRPAQPPASGYVNSMWEKQKAPYAGDVVNSYNDGPTEPGKASLGGFYELETSSPAAALAPKASMVHTERTFHFSGDRAALEPIAKSALHVSLAKVVEKIPR